MQLKKINRFILPVMLFLAATITALIAVYPFFHKPAIAAGPTAEPDNLQPMSPEMPEFSLYPPVIHTADVGEVMLATDSFFYPFRDSTLPYTYYPTGSDTKAIITTVKIIPLVSLFPGAYIIQYKGYLVKGTETTPFEMEESNDWPNPMKGAIAWHY